MKQEKTDLEKSHSKWSNFKLTFVCFLAIIFFACIWACVFAYPTILGQQMFLIHIIASGAGELLCILLLFFFKR